MFRRCRRKWFFQSPLCLNLTSLSEVSPHLWFGSGFHFALEDYHGYRHYHHPLAAFLAYYQATQGARPGEALELVELADAMLDYYLRWLKGHNEFQTLWVDDKPQVEVSWEVPLWDGIVYAGTFDRVVTDWHGRMWTLDYKTAQRITTSKLEMDPQVTAYAYAFERLYGRPMEGMVYMQFLKSPPTPPRLLADGHLSVNKNQGTSYELYKQAIIDRYGNKLGAIPPHIMRFCRELKEKEGPEGDRYIRWDFVRRNPAMTTAEEWKIRAETNEMLNDSLELYPNPTRDCSWDCDFRGPCVAMDDGSDWQSMLDDGYCRKEERNQWHRQLLAPQDLLQWLQERHPLVLHLLLQKPGAEPLRSLLPPPLLLSR
jgi:RecB family exonuclease